VLRFTHAERPQPIATLFQIACHPVPVCLGHSSSYVVTRGLTQSLADAVLALDPRTEPSILGCSPPTVAVPLSAVRIGATTFAFINAEVFNEYQLWQPPEVRLVGYANGEGRYIPTATTLTSGGTR
jgi:hypothetical protein